MSKLGALLHKVRPLRAPATLGRLSLRALRQFAAAGSYAAVLAPWPGDDTFSAGDGYLQRIRMIDQRLLSGQRRIYCYNSPFWTALWIGCFQTGDPNARYLIYNDADPRQCAAVMSLVGQASLCYIHSIYRLLPSVTSGRAPTIILPEAIPCTKVLDLHGFVSDELAMSGAAQDKIDLARRAEAAWLPGADCIVSVTRSMLDCFDEALGVRARRAVILPIMSVSPEQLTDANWHKQDESEPPVVLYSGGLQVWQRIDQMIQAAEQTPAQVSYRFFVSDPEGMRRLLAEKQAVRAYHVDTLPPEALGAEYDRADFGFVLRDDSYVNRVACPTKLIDYLFHGVIPIIHFPDIGDLRALGMQYVTDVDYAAGRLPDMEARRRIREANLQVVRRMLQTYHDGLAEVRQLIR